MNIPVDKLRDYQVAPVRTLVAGLDRFNGLLDASDMGVGKTYIGLATALATGRRPVVILRKAAKPSWHRVAEHFGIKNMVTCNYEMIRTGNTNLGEWFRERYVYRGVTKWRERFEFSLRPDDLLLVDEVHWAKGDGTANSDVLCAAAAQQIRTLCISATAGNNPMHMKSLGYVLGLHKFKDFYPWMMRHGVNKTKFGFQFNCGMSYHALKSDPARLANLQAFTMSQIHRDIFAAGKGVRVRKSEVPGFPKDQIIAVPLDFGDNTTAIGRAYAELAEKLESMEGRRNPLAIMKHAQVEIEKLKAPGIAEEALNMNEEGRHCAIFLNFNESVDIVCKALKTQCCVRGGQSDAVRQKCIDDFQSDKESNIVCNNMAGGESINLHDLRGFFPRGTVICPCPWSELMVQASGRCPRNGSLTDVVQKVPFAAGTIEEETMINFERKCGNITALNDGDMMPKSICFRRN